MGEICEVCGEACPLVEPWHMGGAPGEYEEAMAAHWRLGYEREKARADAAEREHERTKDALGDAFKELREAQSTLAAARRECERLTDIVRCALYEEGYCERTRQNDLAAAPQGHAPGCYASENAGCGCWVGKARYLAPDWRSADHAPECPSRRFLACNCKTALAAPGDGEEGKHG